MQLPGTKRPALSGQHFQVAVIGGGIMGVAIARECARTAPPFVGEAVGNVNPRGVKNASGQPALRLTGFSVAADSVRVVSTTTAKHQVPKSSIAVFQFHFFLAFAIPSAKILENQFGNCR